MEKTLSMLIRDVKNEMIDTINKSNLPPVLLELVVKDIFIEIQQASAQQYQSERETYIKSIEPNKEPTEK